MADKSRKKKAETAEEPSANQSVSGGISYSGSVRIEYRRKGRTYKSYSSHNTGYMPLFSFLGRCLAQDYAVGGAPYGIRLFSMGGAPVETASLTDEVTTGIVQKASTSIAKSDDSVTVNFSFLIPSTMLVDGKTADVIALYGADNADAGSKSSPSATFRIANSDDYITADGDSNIRVVWSMTIANQR